MTPVHLDITRWSSMTKRWKSCISIAKTWPGADCGTDHKLPKCKVQVKFRKKQKQKQKKTVRPKYDLESIPPVFKENQHFKR